MNDLFTSPAASALATTLLHFLWQGFLVAFAFWGFLSLARLQSAFTRYSATMLAFVVLTGCPLLTFAVLYRAQVHRAQIQSPATTGDHMNSVGMRESFGTDAGNSYLLPRSKLRDIASSPTIPRNLEESATSVIWPTLLKNSRPYILMLWLAGVMLSGARLLAGFGNVIWLRWGRFPISVDLAARSREIANRLGLTSAGVFASASIREAAVVGFWRPVVLIPVSWLTSLPTDVLDAVIAHELAHIRRYDVWVNLLQRIVETLLFYHPAVWWLSNQIRLEREMCCDELAVAATGARVEYVRALEQVGRLQLRGSLSLATPFSGDQKMKLLSRVKNILRSSDKPHREPAWLVGILAATIPLFVLGYSVIPNQGAVNAQEREGDAPRRSAEGDAEPRRSAEGDAGPRRSAEGDAGPRRSAEGDAEPRRSAEGDAPRGRGEGAGDRAIGDALRGFKPQTQREAAMLQMILQLQRELTELRQIVQSQNGEGSVRETRDGIRDSEGAAVLPRGWQNTKGGRVFKTYDKDGDEIVSLEEWLAMTNGNASDARRKIQTQRFNEAEPSGDGKFTPAEFLNWYANPEARPRKTARDGDGSRSGTGDGEGSKVGSRDGEGPRKGPRDGEGSKSGPRDGEGTKTGPRDGDRE